MKKEFSVIVFWGSLWGIFEATVGYLLHAINLSIGWLIWFPVAYFFMNRVYKQTGKVHTIFYTSVIAASIKLVDFLLPIRIDKVLNPFASILLEGLAVVLVYKLLELRKGIILKHETIKVLTVSIAWRLLYLLYMLPLPDSFVKLSPFRGTQPLVKFLFLEGLLSGAVIVVCVAAERLFRKDKENIPSGFHSKASGMLDRIDLHPVISFSLLMSALLIQWAL